MNVFVKICGITNSADAWCAVESGADAIGFVAWPASPRYVQPETTAEIIKSLPNSIRKVGVFVDAEPDDIGHYIEAGIDILQLHGKESESFAHELRKQFEIPLWRAIRPQTEQDVQRFAGYPADAFLVDAFSPKLPGGTGKTADWKLARIAVETLGKPVLLAGGLNPENILGALSRVAPFGLDLSSGVESTPGRKDHAKIRELFRALGK
jgi:phosphoribosylanthranilate isomerase